MIKHSLVVTGSVEELSLPIKHLSFDVWQTLIKGSKTFRDANLDLIMKRFNTLGKSRDEIKKIMDDTKEYCDIQANNYGIDIGTSTLWHSILTATTGKCDLELFEDYYEARERLFLEHITPLYDNTVKDTLEVLRGAGYTMSILSNTGLTAGRTLERVLKAHDIAHLFDFKLYSDEIQTAKPNTKAFQLVYEYAKQLYDNHITPEEIMHVGDNIKADIEGAKNYGMHALLINTPEMPFSSLKKLI